jgi:hypothetical protein
VCTSPFKVFNDFNDFHKILQEHYATGGHPNLVLSNFLQLVITTWWAPTFEEGGVLKKNMEL